MIVELSTTFACITGLAMSLGSGVALSSVSFAGAGTLSANLQEGAPIAGPHIDLTTNLVESIHLATTLPLD